MTKSSKRQTRFFQYFCSIGNMFLFSPRQKQIAQRTCRTRVLASYLSYGDNTLYFTGPFKDWWEISRNVLLQMLSKIGILFREISNITACIVNKIQLCFGCITSTTICSAEAWKSGNIASKSVAGRKASLSGSTYKLCWLSGRLGKNQFWTHHALSQPGRIKMMFRENATSRFQHKSRPCWMKDSWL